MSTTLNQEQQMKLIKSFMETTLCRSAAKAQFFLEGASWDITTSIWKYFDEVEAFDAADSMNSSSITNKKLGLSEKEKDVQRAEPKHNEKQENKESGASDVKMEEKRGMKENNKQEQAVDEGPMAKKEKKEESKVKRTLDASRKPSNSTEKHSKRSFSTRVLVKFSDRPGDKLGGKFGVLQTVGDIRNFIKENRPEFNEQPFSLFVNRPNMYSEELMDESLTIKQCGLDGCYPYG